MKVFYTVTGTAGVFTAFQNQPQLNQWIGDFGAHPSVCSEIGNVFLLLRA